LMSHRVIDQLRRMPEHHRYRQGQYSLRDGLIF
jgi:hypothetical protein